MLNLQELTKYINTTYGHVVQHFTVDREEEEVQWQSTFKGVVVIIFVVIDICVIQPKPGQLVPVYSLTMIALCSPLRLSEPRQC